MLWNKNTFLSLIQRGQSPVRYLVALLRSSVRPFLSWSLHWSPVLNTCSEAAERRAWLGLTVSGLESQSLDPIASEPIEQRTADLSTHGGECSSPWKTGDGCVSVSVFLPWSLRTQGLWEQGSQPGLLVDLWNYSKQHFFLLLHFSISKYWVPGKNNL